MTVVLVDCEMAKVATDGKWITFEGEITERNKSDMILHKVKCFQVATEFLESIEVPYFVTDGTLLSIYREQGKFIVHDLDTDVSMLEEYLHTVWKSRHLLPEGYVLETTCPDTGVEWCDENGCSDKETIQSIRQTDK